MDLLLAGLLGHLLRTLVHAAVLQLALHRVRALRKQSLHPFVEKQPRAIHKLVEHPRRQIIRQPPGFDQPALGPLLGRQRHHTTRHGSSTFVYGLPSAVITRSPRPSAGPRLTNST